MVEAEGSVEVIAAGGTEAETTTEANHVVIQDRLRGEGRHHHVANAMSMFRVAEDGDVEIVVTILANAVALFRTIAPYLLHLVVRAAHPRQIDHKRRHAVDHDDLLQLIAPDLHLAALEGPRHPELEGEDKGHGLPAMTTGDYPGILHDLSPHQSNQAHQRPGCQHHDPEHHLDGAADRPPLHVRGAP